MQWGIAAMVFLAAFGLMSAMAAEDQKILSGHVVDVDRERGALTLQFADKTQARFEVSPGLLRPIRLGEPVKVVVEGKTVRLIGQL